MKMKLSVAAERLAFSAPFRIAGHVFEHQDAIVATLEQGGQRGRGEACGVFYLGDSAAGMAAQIEAQRTAIEAGIDRTALQALLPPGGARNALDCALWELESWRSGVPVWQLAQLSAPKPLITTFTLGAEDPQVMAAGARRYASAKALKLKFSGDLPLDLARLRAVREVSPEVWLGVDANQAYRIADLERLVRELAAQRVALLEQPLARGHEAELESFDSPIPLAADESALSLSDLPGLVGRFQVVNIKLDKCGGLTEGLAMAHTARALGLKVMVGNMMGSSLAMAPSFVLGQLCDVVDLDGPTFLSQDRRPGVEYHQGLIWCAPQVWGAH
jgi:L-alanine-DL-glutamate epimerase-like enolase superfamily enzyme